MRLSGLLVVLTVFFFNLAFAKLAFSTTCAHDCADTCRISAGGFGGVEPVCFSNCRAWQAFNCWDLKDPYVASMGEIGSRAYPLAASVTKTRNPNHQALDEDEKKILRPLFGNLVDYAKLHLRSQMLDEWGEPPFEIALGSTAGQTFGDDIYIRYTRSELDRVERVVLVGHELCHTWQYYQRNQSFQKFGRDYFEGYARNGGYRNNGMEEECYDMEKKIRSAAEVYFAWFDQHKRKWHFDVCNDSGFESIFVAYGFPHRSDGLTLVAAPFVKGWYEVKRSQCRRILSNIESGQAVDAFATTGASGDWTFWGGGGDNEYCIDPLNAFEHSYRLNCNRRGLDAVAFKPILNSWQAYKSETNTWRLVGNPTQLKICNRSGKRIWGALSRIERSQWKARGWFEFNVDQCREWNLGVYDANIYIYGESDGAQTIWEDRSKPAFCVHRGTAFSVPHRGICAKGGTTVFPFEFKVQAGMNTWAFNP